jgi:hypothetical protein
MALALALALAIAMGYGTRYDENEQTQRRNRGVRVSKRGLLVQGPRKHQLNGLVWFGLAWFGAFCGRSTTMLGNLLAHH